MPSLKIKEPSARFSIQRTMDGFEVVDQDGTPVSESVSANIANQISNDLNFAAYAGRTNLVNELIGELDFS